MDITIFHEFQIQDFVAALLVMRLCLATVTSTIDISQAKVSTTEISLSDNDAAENATPPKTSSFEHKNSNSRLGSHAACDEIVLGRCDFYH
jgi:hypothetical protein